MDYFILVLGFFVAYLIGSIPSAVWVGKWFYKVDVREEGSGNAGATNTIRVLGSKAGVPVVIIDILKGYFAVWLMQYFIPEGTGPDVEVYYKIVAGLLAVVGHALPIFAGFRGGKGVATLLGIGIGLYGWAVWLIVGIFILIVAVTRYVSLGSILAAISFPLLVIFYFDVTNPGLIGLSVFVAIFIVWTHRKNISRLLKGKESKFSFRKSKS